MRKTSFETIVRLVIELERLDGRKFLAMHHQDRAFRRWMKSQQTKGMMDHNEVTRRYWVWKRWEAKVHFIQARSAEIQSRLVLDQVNEVEVMDALAAVIHLHPREHIAMAANILQTSRVGRKEQGNDRN